MENASLSNVHVAKAASMRETMKQLAMTLALALALASAASISLANERILLVQALQFLQRAEAVKGVEQATLLGQAHDRLQQIVVEHPDSATARQLQSDGIPVLGGTPVTLVGLLQRVAEFCFAAPTAACVWDQAITTARGIVKPSRRNAALQYIVRAQAEVGAVEAAMSTARGIEGPLERVKAFTKIAGAQAEVGAIDAATTTARGIEDPKRRAWAFAHIAKAKAEAGAFDAAMRTARSIEDPKSRAWAFVEIGKVLWP